ncbi:hypothetical protein [Actinophytocola sp.]|uniref:hypothetical protein n=1 Tax=Actinophytocola sp. TaxID=1872138 RepID=UPI002D7EFB63|nr:hypothetical protein [Actinophytocola sp.]HET9144105.1 hypothetical protein [Actinophytocola sp.]
MSGVEINLQELGDDSVPGLRVEVGLDELRESLATACEHGARVSLHFGPDDELHGLVAEVGAGVLMFDSFDGDENEREIVPLDRILWARIRRPA